MINSFKKKNNSIRSLSKSIFTKINKINNTKNKKPSTKFLSKSISLLNKHLLYKILPKDNKMSTKTITFSSWKTLTTAVSKTNNNKESTKMKISNFKTVLKNMKEITTPMKIKIKIIIQTNWNLTLSQESKTNLNKTKINHNKITSIFIKLLKTNMKTL